MFHISDVNMYINRIIQPKRKSFFLLGPRGTGKSTWLRHNFKDAFYFDLLDPSRYQHALSDPSYFESVVIQNGADVVVVDEFQRIPELLNSVHRLIEERKTKFILSGSSARKIRRAGVNLLAGRALNLAMHPFTPNELGKDFHLDKALKVGLLPSVYFDPEPYETLAAYADLYIKQEIQTESLVRNLGPFLRFLQVCSLCHGQVLNLSSVARDVGSPRSSVQGHLQILQDTMLGLLLPAYVPKLRVREKTAPKFYFFDAGIARYLRFKDANLGPGDLGPIFEGLVLQILLAFKDYTGLFNEIFYWSPSRSKLEVDFVIEKAGKLVAIEAKYSKRLRKEHLAGLKSLAELKNVKRRIIVHPGPDSMALEDGIEALSFQDFTKLLANPGDLFRNAPHAHPDGR